MRLDGVRVRRGAGVWREREIIGKGEDNEIAKLMSMSQTGTENSIKETRYWFL